MATKKDDFFVEKKSPAVKVPKATGPIPGTVVVLNKRPVEIDITLTDGTNLDVGPKVRGKNLHVSRQIPRKLLPPYVQKMARRGEIEVKDVGGVN